jgi:hypothetical protein
MLKFYPAEEDCRSKWLKVVWYFSIEMKQSNSETPGQGSDRSVPWTLQSPRTKGKDLAHLSAVRARATAN